MSSKPLFNLLNSSWKSTGDQHNFQYFRFLTKGRSLLATQEERNFTAKRGSVHKKEATKPAMVTHVKYNYCIMM